MGYVLVVQNQEDSSPVGVLGSFTSRQSAEAAASNLSEKLEEVSPELAEIYFSEVMETTEIDNVNDTMTAFLERLVAISGWEPEDDDDWDEEEEEDERG